MWVMNDVFRPYVDNFVIIYIDDILIFNSSMEEHVRHVKQDLEVLHIEKLYLKLCKCKFGKTYLIYVGYIVGGGHLKIGPTKIDVIVKWPRPQTVTEVRSFQDVVQYWRILISQFSLIASSLHALT